MCLAQSPAARAGLVGSVCPRPAGRVHEYVVVVEGALLPGPDKGLVAHQANDDLGGTTEHRIHIYWADAYSQGEVVGDHMGLCVLGPKMVRNFTRQSSLVEATLNWHTSTMASSMRTWFSGLPL